MSSIISKPKLKKTSKEKLDHINARIKMIENEINLALSVIAKLHTDRLKIFFLRDEIENKNHKKNFISFVNLIENQFDHESLKVYQVDSMITLLKSSKQSDNPISNHVLDDFENTVKILLDNILIELNRKESDLRYWMAQKADIESYDVVHHLLFKKFKR